MKYPLILTILFVATITAMHYYPQYLIWIILACVTGAILITKQFISK